MTIAEEPVFTSAACNDCEWASATGSVSILPFTRQHADFHDHRLTANAWADDARGQRIVASVTVEPTMTDD
jgi:hypothetical protein